MAKLNKYMGIGRLGADPEKIAFNNGGHMAKFSLCINERKKNNATGEWEDDPLWMDCEVFNYGERGTLADVVLDYCRKGMNVFCEGHLKMDKWEDRETGQKRSKIKFVVTNLQMLDKKDDGDGRNEGSRNESRGGSRNGGRNESRGNGGRNESRGTGTRNGGGNGGRNGGRNGGGTGGGYDYEYDDRPAPANMNDDIPF